MKQIPMTRNKLFLSLAVALLLLFVIFGLVMMFRWPLWVIFFYLAFFGCTWSGIVFIRKILQWRREKYFVNQVISQNDSYLQNVGGREKESTKGLGGQFEEAIHVLGKSNLKKYGNPLYGIPWYMVIGESGSGKTTAIKSARLSPLFSDSRGNSCISETNNCVWWFFEQAIILDMDGGFAVRHEEGSEKDEWHKFLSFLLKFRKKKPINGLIVTVAADKLLDPDTKNLKEVGSNVCRIVDQLLRVFGARFPIYLMVTKCDLVHGMIQFCSNLSEKNLDQAMGMINQDRSGDIFGFHERAVRSIGDRLRDLRLLIFQCVGSKIDPEILLFPEEFDQIKPGLDAFIKSAFQENPYQKELVLRGIFFSSGLQEGSPYSYFMNSLEFSEERVVLPEAQNSFFLKDFFVKILPKDSELFAPTKQILYRQRWAANLALASWMSIAVVFCGLLTFSFFKNISTLKDAAKDFTPPPVLTGEVFADMATMDRFRHAILNIEERNKQWWVPHFWLTERIEIENRLKEKYCKSFRDGFLLTFDTHLTESIFTFSRNTSDEILGRHVAHLVRRINLLKARLEGEELEELKKKPQPFFDTIAVLAKHDIDPEMREQLYGLYLFDLIWRDDTSKLNQEINLLQSGLQNLLDLRSNGMQWVVAWINMESAIFDIGMQDFWRSSFFSETDYSIKSDGNPEKKEEKPAFIMETIVHRAFTSTGKKIIDAFIQEMEEALPDPILIANRKKEFEKWYHESYFNAWYEFAKKFPKGINLIHGKKKWQQAAAIMVSDKNPYVAFLDTLAEELEPFYGIACRDHNLQLWADMVIQFYIVKSQLEDSPGESDRALRDSGIVKRTMKKVKDKITGSLEEKVLEGNPDEEKLEQTRLIAAKAYEQYKNALQEIAPIAFSKQFAFQMTGAAFEDDQASRTSPFFTAQNAVQVLKTVMTGKEAEQPVFWELVKGPLDFMWEYATHETSCEIKSLWEKDVMGEIQGISDINGRAYMLFGQDGLVTNFISGPAKPFVGVNSSKSYYAKETFGKKIPFEKSFLDFMTQGTFMDQPKQKETRQKTQSRFLVNIRGLPTDANSEALMKPHATNLNVQCKNQNYSIINLNYPVQKSINWSRETCEDVVFSIEVGNLILKRRYRGSDAFPRFLKDFSPGTRVFYPKDFPQNQSALKRLGITYIRVNYQFKNYEPVISLLKEEKTGPRLPVLPKNIVQCWDEQDSDMPESGEASGNEKIIQQVGKNFRD